MNRRRTVVHLVTACIVSITLSLLLLIIGDIRNDRLWVAGGPVSLRRTIISVWWASLATALSIGVLTPYTATRRGRTIVGGIAALPIASVVLIARGAAVESFALAMLLVVAGAVCGSSLSSSACNR
jgi:hypothetical protein